MNLCIPKINSNIKLEYIYKNLSNIHLFQKIEKIIEIPLKNNPMYKRILIKVIWNDNENSKKIKEKLKNNGSINFVYNFPWYWKILITNHKM